MKIIDLLNMIAKGEVVPKTIVYYDNIYKYHASNNFYYDTNGSSLYRQFCEFGDCLNEEVEIVEEDKKIEYPLIHKIGPDEITGDKEPNEWYLLNCNFVNLNRAVWQLIDAVNKLQSKG